MRLLLFLILIIFVNYSYGVNNKFSEQQYRQAFTEWTLKFDRKYGSEEFGQRYAIFKNNMDYVNDWNSKGSETVLGLNRFADITNLEYRNTYLGTKVNTNQYNGYDGHTVQRFGRQQNAVSIDWRTKKVVTPIKDQGQCGSCWSFSTTGSTEGAHALKTGNLVSLSEQNLVDCSASEGNMGCDGGLMNLAFEYIISNGGIDTEESYPYTAETGTTCLFKKKNIGATISGYVNITAGSETSLENGVQHGPVSVAIDASHNSFQLYSTGVYYEPKCSTEELDHGVLVVGYGTSSSDEHARQNIRIHHNDDFGIDEVEPVETDKPKSLQYWIVKNSWGTTWGQEGYIWMSKNRKNNCGIASCASYPTV